MLRSVGTGGGVLSIESLLRMWFVRPLVLAKGKFIGRRRLAPLRFIAPDIATNHPRLEAAAQQYEPAFSKQRQLLWTHSVIQPPSHHS
ncbi:hypothetical protein [Fuerstiella marisgermanici]|uniref:hypothetical protein n=1 Tax=Fuerstiella marisgermanici TaxID=1891926 RepID=UPI001314D223|nr:hypothetical protein [Fuerstiella marisgermanici]